METYYIAGPMSGIEHFNYPAFENAADELRRQGFEVVSPVELDGDEGVDGVLDEMEGVIDERGWADCLARDVALITSPEVDGVVVLPGWEESKGAALEVHVARTLGKPILAFPSLEPVKAPTRYRPPAEESILETAERLVVGDRQASYGHPAEDFTRTADTWRALFGWDATPKQVALAMIVVKLSRLQQTPDKRDSLVDVAGYARAYELVMDREAEPRRSLREPDDGVRVELVRPGLVEKDGIWTAPDHDPTTEQQMLERLQARRHDYLARKAEQEPVDLEASRRRSMAKVARALGSER